MTTLQLLAFTAIIAGWFFLIGYRAGKERGWIDAHKEWIKEARERRVDLCTSCQNTGKEKA